MAANIGNYFPLPCTELTAGEAQRFVRKMYRFTQGSTFQGRVTLTTAWRAPTVTVTVDQIIVNPRRGWRGLVTELAYPFFWLANHRTASVEDHDWLVQKMTREVYKRKYLDGRLKDKPKPPPTKTDKQRAAHKNTLKLIKQWESKQKRASNALKKLHKKRKYYEKQLNA